MKTAADILKSASETYLERNAVYKDNCQTYSYAMRALFPDGVKLTTYEDHYRFHLFILAMVKLSRYAQQWETGHSDSLRDATVYLAMLEAFDANK